MVPLFIWGGSDGGSRSVRPELRGNPPVENPDGFTTGIPLVLLPPNTGGLFSSVPAVAGTP